MRPTLRQLVVASAVVGALSLGFAPPTRAQEGDAQIAPGGRLETFARNAWRDSAAVRQVLDANPGSDLIICIAGCKGAGQPVVLLKKPVLAAAVIARGMLAAEAGNHSARPADAHVICLAGCVGESGSVVFEGRRMAWIRQDGREALTLALARFATEAVKAVGPLLLSGS